MARHSLALCQSGCIREGHFSVATRLHFLRGLTTLSSLDLREITCGTCEFCCQNRKKDNGARDGPRPLHRQNNKDSASAVPESTRRASLLSGKVAFDRL